ncbi:hypothetical protein D3C75_1131790 [compost metagenome]
MRGIGVHAFFMQQPSHFVILHAGQKGFARARSMHWQLATNRGRHAHQRGALHLIDNHRLILGFVHHRQIDRFTRLFHQAAQRWVHHGQQVTALQKAAAHHKCMCPHGP